MKDLIPVVVGVAVLSLCCGAPFLIAGGLSTLAGWVGGNPALLGLGLAVGIVGGAFYLRHRKNRCCER